MCNDKFLDIAIELVDITQNVKLLDYRNSKLPNAIDEKIIDIFNLIMAGTSSGRNEFVSLLSRDTTNLLRVFGSRMTMLGVRKNSYDYLLKGLVALAFAATETDYRDILMTISLFHHSAKKLNIDSDQLFDTASQYATDDSVRELILGYLDRAPEDQNIEQMGYREVYGSNGLIYQFADHPIPDGWL
jgi:hypothetical protein